jgi:hypothetical protein
MENNELGKPKPPRPEFTMHCSLFAIDLKISFSAPPHCAHTLHEPIPEKLNRR